MKTTLHIYLSLNMLEVQQTVNMSSLDMVIHGFSNCMSLNFLSIWLCILYSGVVTIC